MALEARQEYLPCLLNLIDPIIKEIRIISKDNKSWAPRPLAAGVAYPLGRPRRWYVTPVITMEELIEF